jgi:homopolymeric O-antigen transport system ATP-binding protein
MSDVLIRAEGVSKKFCRTLKRSLWYGVKDTLRDLAAAAGRPDLRRDEFWAVDGVSFEVRRGECLGLIGRNGAGKTTVLKMLNGLFKPDKGRIEMRGRISALIALGAGFNSILTGRENVYIYGSVLGLSKKEIDRKFDEIVDFAEVGDFLDTPVQSYSSGMQVRLGFAVATALQPDILLVDEVLAVGDARFRWKCLGRIKRLKENGVSIILVSHRSDDLMRTCTKGLVLKAGKTTFDGGIEQAVLGYEQAPDPGVSQAQLRGNGEGSPVHISAMTYRVNGSPATTMRCGDALDVVIEVQSLRKINQARIVLGLFHSEIGSVFAVSSFASLGWISINEGINVVIVSLGELPIQFGSYHVEASVRGPEIGDIYDAAKATTSLRVTEPVPNFEGFGVNGVILPAAEWQLY